MKQFSFLATDFFFVDAVLHGYHFEAAILDDVIQTEKPMCFQNTFEYVLKVA